MVKAFTLLLNRSERRSPRPSRRRSFREGHDGRPATDYREISADGALPNGDALGKLARHETTLMNAFTKTLQMLLLLQENRAESEVEDVIIEVIPPPANAA